MEAEAPVATSARNRQAATRELKVATWNIHGSVDYLYFGGDNSTTRAFNNGDSGHVIGLGGVGLTY